MKAEEMQYEAMKNDILNKMLTKGALERIGRVKMSSPIVGTKLELYLLQLYQSGRFESKIDDKKLKQILDVLIPAKRKTKIQRKRK